MTNLEYKLLSCLYGIQQMCIGEIAMNYKLDAEYIGRMISETTGMTVAIVTGKQIGRAHV